MICTQGEEGKGIQSGTYRTIGVEIDGRLKLGAQGSRLKCKQAMRSNYKNRSLKKRSLARKRAALYRHQTPLRQRLFATRSMRKAFYHWGYSSSASDSPQLLAILLAAVACTELLGMVMRLRVTEEITGKSSDLREVGGISSGLDR